MVEVIMSKVTADRVIAALDKDPELRDQVKARLNATENPDGQPDHEGVATTRGRDYALVCLAWRRANRPDQVDNGKLHAGSPMYYYCKSCGHLADRLPETHMTVPRSLCGECQALKDLDWLE